MDFTVPYTFYPVALPHWLAWLLFLLAILAGTTVGMTRGLKRGMLQGVLAGGFGVAAFLLVTMVASMVIVFFMHDQ
jgi:hypothetical protein